MIAAGKGSLHSLAPAQVIAVKALRAGSISCTERQETWGHRRLLGRRSWFPSSLAVVACWRC